MSGFKPFDPNSSGGGGLPATPDTDLFQVSGTAYVKSAISGNERCFVWSSDTTATDPGPGGIKVDKNPWDTATELYISKFTTSGIPFDSFLKLLVPNDHGVINNEKDQTQALFYRATQTPQDNGTWFTIRIQPEGFGVTPAAGAVVSTQPYETGSRPVVSSTSVMQWSLPLPVLSTTYDTGYDAALGGDNVSVVASVEMTSGAETRFVFKTVPAWLLSARPNQTFGEVVFFEATAGEGLMTMWYDTITLPLTPTVKVRFSAVGAKTIANAEVTIA